MHADHNIALGFRSAPGDYSIAREAMVLISGSSLFACSRQPPHPNVAQVQAGVLELARMFQLPVINSRMLMPQRPSASGVAAASKGASIECIDRTTTNLFHCTPLRQRVESSGRRILLLCGAVLEVDVHLSAITALKRGFEVHVLIDACSARSCLTESAMLQSLAVAGVNLTTLATLAGQLLADVTDASALPVLELLENLEASRPVDAPATAPVGASERKPMMHERH
jgi:nicotinamidase-related amidase